MSRPSRPVIGINADFIAEPRRSRGQARLDSGYFDAILAAGGLPIILPPLVTRLDLSSFLDRVDGVVLSGGLDLDPRHRGLPSHPAVQTIAERRDESDRLMVRLILERQFPVFAIGLGMQQLNLAGGGNLYLHLPDEQPRVLAHGSPGEPPHFHSVLIEPGTRFEEIYGGREIRVNSTHHQSVRQVGSPFLVAGMAPDGIVEAMEAVDPQWCCLAVQWHPEAETASAHDPRLFDYFVQACMQGTKPLPLAA